MSFDETLSRSSNIQEMSWKAERTMSIVLAKHLIGVTQHPSTIIVRVVGHVLASPVVLVNTHLEKPGIR